MKENKIAEIAYVINDDLDADSSAGEIVKMVLGMGHDEDIANGVATYLGR